MVSSAISLAPGAASSHPAARFARLARDPRHFQLAALGLLLCHGIVNLDFDVSPEQIVLTVGCALLSQLCRR